MGILTPKFRLSNRQAKELCERARPLEIAIPVPGHIDPQSLVTELDAMLFASTALSLPDGASLVAAWLQSVPVLTNLDRAGIGLSAVYGTILDDGECRPASHLIASVITHIDPTRPARHSRMATQWPGSILPIGAVEYL